MALTNSQKTQRSQIIRGVKDAAAQFGLTVIEQNEIGGRALVGEWQGGIVVWLESDRKWHRVGNPLSGSGF